MPIANQTAIAISLRFTSIESLDHLNDQICDIAIRHGFQIEFKSESTFNAPFCGSDYFVKEFYTDANPLDCGSQSFLNELDVLTEQFADSFIETVE